MFMVLESGTVMNFGEQEWLAIGRDSKGENWMNSCGSLC